MQVGISTASLFLRKTTEEALEFLSQNGVSTAEVFLESYCEYNKEFGRLLKSVQGNVNVHSVHTLTTQFEPQLYSINKRAQKDSFTLLENTMACAKEIGAKYYTFHGVARVKRTPMVINFERVAEITNRIIETTNKYGVDLAYENVHWSYYNYIGFFTELRKRVNGLKGTLDIKQAYQSKIDYAEFLNEMGRDIVTVHLSDRREDGKMCLPGRGTFNFEKLFNQLADVNFNGALLLEVYKDDFKEYSELFESLEYVQLLADKVFGR